jgi:hypothetical protein
MMIREVDSTRVRVQWDGWQIHTYYFTDWKPERNPSARYSRSCSNGYDPSNLSHNFSTSPSIIQRPTGEILRKAPTQTI